MDPTQEIHKFKIPNRYICFYLQQFSTVPGLTAKGVKVAADQEQQHDNDHQEPGEDEAEAGTPESTVDQMQWVGYVAQSNGFSAFVLLLLLLPLPIQTFIQSFGP